MKPPLADGQQILICWVRPCELTNAHLAPKELDDLIGGRHAQLRVCSHNSGFVCQQRALYEMLHQPICHVGIHSRQYIIQHVHITILHTNKNHETNLAQRVNGQKPMWQAAGQHIGLLMCSAPVNLLQVLDVAADYELSYDFL